MKRNLVIFAIILLTISANSYGQKKFRKGYVISNMNDTIYGLIDNSNIRQSHSYIYFKENESDKPIVYKPIELAGFSVEDQVFASKILRVDKSPNSDDELLRDVAGEVGVAMLAIKQSSDFVTRRIIPFRAEGESNKSEERMDQYSAYQILDIDTLFVNVCVTGYANLYYHVDEDRKPHYFYGNELFDRELVRLRYLNLGSLMGDSESYTSIVELDFYIVQLMEYFDICPELNSKIKDMNFELDDMVDIFKDFNICAGAENFYVRPMQKSEIYIHAIAGISFNTGNFTGNSHQYLDMAEFDYTPGYLLGVGFDFDFDGKRKGFGLYGELTYRNYNLNGIIDNYVNTDTYDSGEISLSSSELDLLFGLRYTFTSSKVAPFIDAGFAYISRFNTESSITGETSYFGVVHELSGPAINDIKPSTFNYYAGAGFSINNRLGLHLKYQTGNGVSPYMALSSSATTISLSLSYIFVKQAN